MNDLEQSLRRLADPNLYLDAPAQVGVDDRLVAGRTTLRRRRVRLGAGLVAAAAVVGVVAVGAVQATDPSKDTSPTVAVEPPSDPAVAIMISDNLRTEDAGVSFDARGQLERHPDAVVTQLVADPIPTDAEQSFAVALSFQGEDTWVYLYWSRGGPIGGGSKPADDSENFVAWAHAITPDEFGLHEQTAS